MTMIQKSPKDRQAGWIQAKIEPSTQIGRGLSGIYMEINDHYQLPDPENPVDAEPMIRILRERFDSSLKNSETIIDQIMELKR